MKFNIGDRVINEVDGEGVVVTKSNYIGGAYKIKVVFEKGTVGFYNEKGMLKGFPNDYKEKLKKI